jgi:outer membrane lipoprotein-sorting protein
VIDRSDVFELLHRSQSSFRTLRAVIRQWHDNELMEKASDRAAEQSNGSSGTLYMVTFGSRDEEPSNTYEQTTRLWLAPPRRVRIEMELPHGSHLQITNGERMWTHMPQVGAFVQERNQEADDGHEAFLDSAPLLATLELELLGETEAAGRRALRLRGVPRAGAERRAFFELDQGADEYELLIDAERGVLLRREARIDGEPFSVTEVQEIAFDEDLPTQTFEFEPPPGEEVKRPEEIFGGFETEHDLAGAAAKASFAVWIASGLGPGWHVNVTYMPARERPPVPETLFLDYSAMRDEIEHFSLHERSATEPLEPDDDTTVIERSGRRMHVWEPPEHRRQRMPTIVRLELEGTAVEVHGQGLGTERLLDIAAGLCRAPTERPAL